MSDRPTPETDAMWEKWSDDRLPNGQFRYGPLDLADHARRLERQRDELLEMVARCEMWLSTLPEGRAMQLACRAAIAAVKGGRDD